MDKVKKEKPTLPQGQELNEDELKKIEEEEIPDSEDENDLDEEQKKRMEAILK